MEFTRTFIQESLTSHEKGKENVLDNCVSDIIILLTVTNVLLFI